MSTFDQLSIVTCKHSRLKSFVLKKNRQNSQNKNDCIGIYKSKSFGFQFVKVKSLRELIDILWRVMEVTD